MMKAWGIDVKSYGISLIDKERFYLIRNYDNIAQRKESQEAFYGSEEWINGPEKAIMSCIDTYNTVVIDNATFNTILNNKKIKIND
jgi:hypothetical protein